MYVIFNQCKLKNQSASVCKSNLNYKPRETILQNVINVINLRTQKLHLIFFLLNSSFLDDELVLYKRFISNES